MTPGVPSPHPDTRKTGRTRPTGRHLRGAQPQGSLGIAGHQPRCPSALLALRAGNARLPAWAPPAGLPPAPRTRSPFICGRDSVRSGALS